MALTGFIDGVGENLKHSMLTALQTIGPKDNRRPQPHPIGALEHGNTLIAIGLLFLSHKLPHLQMHIIIHHNYTRKKWESQTPRLPIDP